MVKCNYCGSPSWTYKGMVMFPPGGPGHVPLPRGEYHCNNCGKTFYDEVLNTPGSSGPSSSQVIGGLFILLVYAVGGGFVFIGLCSLTVPSAAAGGIFGILIGVILLAAGWRMSRSRR